MWILNPEIGRERLTAHPFVGPFLIQVAVTLGLPLELGHDQYTFDPRLVRAYSSRLSSLSNSFSLGIVSEMAFIDFPAMVSFLQHWQRRKRHEKTKGLCWAFWFLFGSWAFSDR